MHIRFVLCNFITLSTAQSAFYFTFCQQSHWLRVAFSRQRSDFWETSNTEISFLPDVYKARLHCRHSFSWNSSSLTEKQLRSVVMSLASQPERPVIRGKKSAYKIWFFFLIHWPVNNDDQNTSVHINIKVFAFTYAVICLYRLLNSLQGTGNLNQ